MTTVQRIQMIESSVASMRPGQEAPDDGWLPGSLPNDRMLASMRPGQEAPDDQCEKCETRRRCYGFNEAGARSPG